MKKVIIFVFAMILSINAAQAIDKAKVRAAVEHQIKLFPDITLQDLYKGFFQDCFGPEHLVSDSATVAKYINEELAAFDSLSGPDADQLGFTDKFVRVNLSVIKSGEFSEDEFIKAFMKSAKPTGYTVEKWKKDWREIDAVIASMKLNLPDYAEMSPKIFAMIDSGKYVMHHSEKFNKYNFHYRLMSTEVYTEYFTKHHKTEIMDAIKAKLQEQGLDLELGN